MKYDLKKIMLNAWKNYRRYSISFAEALHRAWLSAKAEEINAERIKRSKEAADVTEDTNTWVGWKKLGYEVIHGSKALFGCSLIWGSKGDGASYNASFFGRSQVQAVGYRMVRKWKQRRKKSCRWLMSATMNGLSVFYAL